MGLGKLEDMQELEPTAAAAEKMQRHSERLKETRGCCVALSEALAGLQLVDLKVFLNTKSPIPFPPHSLL